ncbi:integral membrane protein [Aspergillus nomiae NRRL 13137]|uniref:Integral membrane protein n=1 Tax=Aspergillus nomiae NRRL (strain ATCC 15546 / NRRL 13137 / CBS 260.88 / M93) TaxID=1509407 RepID=A0A0L1J450_ASPN3|nr:uncharacterized protein ANOM_005986 [Aspergillus nomiae NRRL 13137]KNG86218.1 integral membrane protein [Aspergillus nomiae NRRL 13137]
MASTYPDGIFDSLGKFYVSVAIVWTVALLVGSVFLVINRHEQCIRIRNLPLALSAVLCLHIYWILCMLAYTMAGAYPCGVEYWIMSIYLPLGIALFQANSMQLLSVSGIQEKMLHTAHQPQKSSRGPGSKCPSQYWRQWKEMNLVHRTEVAIAVGMAVQLCLSLSVYLASRKFHGFGSFSERGSLAECRRGPEWQDSLIPSILWQLFWSWIFAPCILWKIRKIRDIHHWRLQITLCVIAALPGSPLWFIALNSTSEPWTTINRHWVPALWFTPGIVAMEGVTVFFPFYELVVSRKQRDRILGAIAAWNEKKVNDSESDSGTSRSQAGSSRMNELYSIKALEKCLADDSHALLHFAAAKEFSGENIIFLNYVRDWKASWARINASNPEYDWTRDPQYHRLHFFKIAVEIYSACVNLKTAEFPINVESRIYSDLTAMFGDAVQCSGRRVSRGTATHMEEDTRALCLDENPYVSQSIMHIKSRVPDSVAVPVNFGISSFDEAQKSILTLVFTNTWPKFIDSSSDDLSIKF